MKGTTFAAIKLMLLFLPSLVLHASANEAPSRLAVEDGWDGLNEYIHEAMERFSIPGVALGVLLEGKVILAKGYGVQSIDISTTVDENTLFAIASNSKAMTAVSLAILIDRGKLHWNDRVIDYIPEFRLSDPYATHHFRIRDLLIHQSGLGVGAGDLMFFPQTDFTMDEVLTGLKYLPVIGEFRADFSYNNLFYAVAGEIVHRVSKLSWGEFVEQNIFEPLGMTNCFATLGRATAGEIADRHILQDGRLVKVNSWHMDVAASAGGVVCDLEGMVRWAELMLANGKLANGRRLFSRERYNELTQPRVIVPQPPFDSDAFDITMTAYGFGWAVSDRNGELFLRHAGSLLGMVSMVSLMPERGAGVIVLTNQQSSAGLYAITTYLLKRIAGAEQEDWISLFDSRMSSLYEKFDAIEVKVSEFIEASEESPFGNEELIGTYHDPWRGDVFIRANGGQLTLEFDRTVFLKGYLEHFRNGVFVVRWFDRTLNADAFVRFSTGFEGDIEGMAMHAISGRTDFSFDFHDLNFTRMSETSKEASAK